MACFQKIGDPFPIAMFDAVAARSGAGFFKRAVVTF